MPLLLGIFSLLGTGFSFIAKNPFVLKMIIFPFFLGILAFAFIYLKSLVAPYIVNNSLLSLAAYFGIFDAISLYLTIIVAGFGVKQILAFIRS